jgi:hypothetical protein
LVVMLAGLKGGWLAPTRTRRGKTASSELSDSYDPGAVSPDHVEPGLTPSRRPVSIVLSIATLLPAVPALTLQRLASRADQRPASAVS